MRLDLYSEENFRKDSFFEFGDSEFHKVTPDTLLFFEFLTI